MLVSASSNLESMESLDFLEDRFHRLKLLLLAITLVYLVQTP